MAQILEKQLFYLDISYTWEGSDAVITYSSKQHFTQFENNLFLLEYVLNNLPKIAELHAAEIAEQKESDLELKDKLDKNHQDIYEEQDRLPETHYHFEYQGGMHGYGTAGESTLILDRNSLKISLPGNAQVLVVPLKNVRNSEIHEEFLVEFAEANDESIFHIYICVEIDGQEQTLHFSRREKHLQAFDQIGQLNYLLHKRMDSFAPLQQSKLITENTDTKSEKPSLRIADELRELKALLDDGILTQEEFDAKKKQLLNL